MTGLGKNYKTQTSQGMKFRCAFNHLYGSKFNLSFSDESSNVS